MTKHLRDEEMQEIVGILDDGGLLDDETFSDVAISAVPSLVSKRSTAPGSSKRTKDDLAMVADQDDAHLLSAWLAVAADRLVQTPRLAHALGVIARRALGLGAPPPIAATADRPELAQRIIALDDTVPFEWAEGAVRTGKAIARIAVPVFRDGKAAAGESRGTAWLIDPEHVVTCKHVVDARARGEDPPTAADLQLQIASSTIQLDYRGGDSSGAIVDVDSLVAHDAHLDFAVLRLAKRIDDRAPLVLRRSPLPTLQPNEPAFLVNIVQHPNGGPKRLAMRNNAVVAIDATDIVYLTDTDEGASGAPVTDDDWNVVAVHRAVQFKTGLQYMGRPVGYANAGTRIDAILACLAKDFPGVGIR